MMVNSFVSRIDYCNSLLASCSQQQLDKLQHVLNCAARVIGLYYMVADAATTLLLCCVITCIGSASESE